MTALVVQDRKGGDLYRVQVGDVGHYLNRLPDGRWLDLTAEQFYAEGETTCGLLPEKRDREYVLSYPDTVARYELLRERLRFSA